MNTKKIYAGIVNFVILAAALVFFGVALAQSANGDNADIQYPIAELGNCQNKESCKNYCDDPGHIEACVAYAEKNNLMTKEEAGQAKKFLDNGAKGPGGCTSKDSCESYCNDISRIDECVAYAEKTGILSPQDLEEAKQVQSAIAKGVTPPPCKNKKECDVYCDDPSNIKVCIAFGEAAGFLKGKDLEDAKKMMAAVEKGAVPPPCKGKEACDVYCQTPENMEACMTFALEAGFMSPKEAEESKGALNAIRKGIKPPACRGQEECDKYCGQKEHTDECIAFSVAAGFMSEKDAEMAKKTGGKGPGGCSGKEECDAFCNKQENQETCFNFGRENGLIPDEQLKQMEEGNKKFYESLNNAPPEVKQCMIEKFGDLSKVFPSRESGDKMGECFNKFMKSSSVPGGPGAGGNIPPGDSGDQSPRTGPGGCQSPDECDAFCKDNKEICANFQQSRQGGQIEQSRIMEQGQRQPMIPGQGEENQPGEYPSQYRSINDGLPFNQNLPLKEINEMPPPYQEGSYGQQFSPPSAGTEQIIPQEQAQPAPFVQPTAPPMPGDATQLTPGSYQQTAPGSFEPPPQPGTPPLPPPPSSDSPQSFSPFRALFFSQDFPTMTAGVFFSSEP